MIALLYALLAGPATPTYARGDRAETNAACIRCHARTARAHAGSLHAASFSDVSFRRGYAAEPAPFCRGCHAPESRPDGEPDPFAQTHGVTCVTCHLPAGAAVVLASARAPQAHAPHGVKRVPDFGTRTCAGCHEFAFPNADALGERGLMQKTLRENEAAGAPDCTSCHRDHAMTVSRDRERLAAALAVTADRHDGDLVLRLEAKGVGHAVPTGDMFRRLVVRVKTPKATLERPLGRTFRTRRDDDGAAVRYEATDERLFPGRPRRLVFDVPADAAWEVVYQRLTGASEEPPYAVRVEDEIVLARGRR